MPFGSKSNLDLVVARHNGRRAASGQTDNTACAERPLSIKPCTRAGRTLVSKTNHGTPGKSYVTRLPLVPGYPPGSEHLRGQRAASSSVNRCHLLTAG
jgi:hypothetical protein